MSPRGTPNINSDEHREALADLSAGPETLGSVSATITDPTPETPTTAWQGPSGQIDLTEAPPPWEVNETAYSASDARRFLSVPATWTLRWINPKLLEQFGWRYWQPVMASDQRVTVHVAQMVGPDNNIRRGSDILAWMPTTWVESRKRQKAEAVAKLTASAVNRQSQLRDEFRRGTYGPYLKLDTATHPTHTIGEGRTMDRD